MTARVNYYEQSPELRTMLSELSLATRKASLEKSLIHLVNIRASQLNGCAFCVDMHVKEARLQGERELRLHHLAIWRESPLFSLRERGALEWTEAVTKLTGQGIPDDIYDRVKQHFSDQEISDLTFVLAVINSWNRLAISFQMVPGSLDQMYGLDRSGLH